jgi:TRAP-type C4-dicarboxylate transport system substrate-binding protein
MNRLVKALAIAGVTSAVSASSVLAQDVILRFGIHNGATHPGALEGAVPLMEAAKGAKVGIDFEFYPGEQAGKALQMFDLVRSGAVDVGFVSTGYTSSDKLPLIGVWEIPGLAASSCAVVAAMMELGSPGGIIYENAYKPNNLRALAYLPYPPYTPSASVTEITSIDDLMGKKTRNAGGLMELTVGVFGGVPVKMAAPEIYQSMQRGTLDMVLLSYLSAESLKLNEVAKFGVTGFSWGTPGDQVMISETKFQSLSKEQQAALLAAGKAASENWCKFVDGNEAALMEKMEASGLKIHRWSDDDVAKMNAMTASIGADWAKQLDERGMPGSETLAAFTALVAK